MMRVTLKKDIHSPPIPIKTRFRNNGDENAINNIAVDTQLLGDVNDNIAVDRQQLNNLHSRLSLNNIASQGVDQHAMSDLIQEDDSIALEELLKISITNAAHGDAQEDGVCTFISVYSRINIVLHTSFAQAWKQLRLKQYYGRMGPLFTVARGTREIRRFRLSTSVARQQVVPTRRHSKPSSPDAKRFATTILLLKLRISKRGP
jgi:hypothetical protein